MFIVARGETLRTPLGVQCVWLQQEHFTPEGVRTWASFVTINMQPLRGW
jgi:hypothetical protein